MKRQLFITAIMAITINTYAQETVEYAKIEDNPDLVADRIVTLSMTGQYGKNTETTVGIEANALIKLQDKVSVFGNFTYGFVNFSNFASYDLEAGALLKFRTKEKVKKVKVVMSWSDNMSTTNKYNSNDGKTYETTTRNRSESFIEDKAIYRKELNLRAGAFSQRSAQESVTFGANFPLYQLGVFGGIEHSSKAAVISTINGEKGITSGLTRLYADALITPVDKSNKVSNGFGIGGRAGFCIYMLPSKSIKAKPESMDARQAYSLFFFKSEIGVRPTQGWFFMLGTGIMLYKNR